MVRCSLILPGITAPNSGCIITNFFLFFKKKGKKNLEIRSQKKLKIENEKKY